MQVHEYLNLRLVRLSPGQEWSAQSSGLLFLFPKGGEGRFTMTTGSFPLVAGDVGVINAGPEHKLSLSGQVDLIFWSFSLCLEHLFPLFSSQELSLLHGVSESLKSGRRYAAASDLAQECHKILEGTPPQSNLDHRCQLLRVAAVVLSLEFKQAGPQRTGFVKIEDHMIQVFEKLSATEIVELSVDDLARRFSCSRRHLNRLFHQYFGFSVASLRMEMRLLKAVSLLRDPDAKIINVAEECGFNHLGLFNSCFKRRFGSSPGQWRKNTSAEGPTVTENPKPAGPVKADDGPHCQLRANGLCPWTGDAEGQRPGLLPSPYQLAAKR